MDGPVSATKLERGVGRGQVGEAGGQTSRWVALGKRLYREYRDDSVADSAAVLSFYFVFSLFPFLFFLATLIAYIPHVQMTTGTLLERIRPIVPVQVMSLLDAHVHALVSTPRPHLLTFGLATTLYSATRGVDAARKALNLAYDVRETRSFWRTEMLAFAVTIGGAVLVFLTIVVLVVGGDVGVWLARKAPVLGEVVRVLHWGRWPMTAFAILCATAMAYGLLPDVRARRRFLTPGSVFATASWFVASLGFRYYAGHFGRYNLTYGSIGSAIILMTWFYITGFILIMGGEIDALLAARARERRGGDGPVTESRAPVAARPGEDRRSSGDATVKDWTGVPSR
jgi:membrane protein